jgi:2-polyprenyl-3-methyl-5-hydroxy-6-metoxy-1,4-benzoquinol methylase
MTKSNCPVCGNEQIQLLFKVTSNESTKHFVRTAGAREVLDLEKHIQKLWGSSECEIFRCSECASRFAKPHISGDSKFYGLAFPDSSYPRSRWEFELTKKLVFESLKNGGRLLEIGGGSGSFINQILKEGVSAKSIVVTEFSSTGIAALTKLGVNVQHVDFCEGVTGAPFRVIVLFQTLEHLDQLDEVMHSLTNLATLDAEMFVSVPNVSYIDWQEKNLRLIDMPPNHITAFSADGLSKLFPKHGWNFVSVKFQNRNSFAFRFKDSALQKICFPSGRPQLLLSKLARMEKSRFLKIRLIFLSGFIQIGDWSWLKSVPSENIWVHLKRNPTI